MLVKTYGSAVYGINATIITIEVNVNQGIGFFLVGLPDSAVKESQQRIESALQSTGYRWPGKKIVINMAPADIKKEGSAYDLPLAVGILAGSEQIPAGKIDQYLIMGELSLDGGLQPIKGVLPIAIQAREQGFKGFILPEQNAREAAVVAGLEVLGVQRLEDVIAFFKGEKEIIPVAVNIEQEFYNTVNAYEHDFADVKGQENVKRALEIAAAGNHNIIII